MRKIFTIVIVLVGFSSCQYVDSTVETLKDNVKSSLEVSHFIPSVNLKTGNDVEKEKKDSVNHFTLSNFFAQKFGL
ncbi:MULTISPECIES: hypothetical protein [Chitinophagaceae]